MAGRVSPREALVELTEVSSQIDSAVLVDVSGDVVASTFGSDEDAARVAEGARSLFAAAEAAGATGRAPLQQLVAETREGAVFVVRSGKGTIAAVTGPEPTSALVFYDLKVTLRDATTPVEASPDA